MRQFFVLFFCCSFHFNVIAADFNQGLSAFNKNDYQQAYKIWLEIANKKSGNVSNSFQWNKSNSEQQKEAQYGISLLYWQGKGVKQDYEKAQQWLIKAAKGGHKEATLKLGFLYFKGLTGIHDFVKAKEWFLKAAQAGLADGQYNLGLLLLQGVAGQKDVQQAKFWLRHAANQGDISAQKQLERLSKTNVKQPLKLMRKTASVVEKNEIKKGIVSIKKEKPIVKETIKDKSIATLISPLGEMKDKKYAIKIATMSSQANMLNMFYRYPSSRWRLHTKIQEEKKLYVLLHCCFFDKETATKVLQKLPEGLKKLKPYIILRKR